MDNSLERLQEHMSSWKINRKMRENEFLAARTASLPSLLQPFHLPSSQDDATRIQIPGHFEIVVQWLDSKSSVIKRYAVATYIFHPESWEYAVDCAKYLRDHPDSGWREE